MASDRTSRLLKSMVPTSGEKLVPVGDDLILPNHSGVSSHAEGITHFGGMYVPVEFELTIVTQSVPTEINDGNFVESENNCVVFNGHALRVIKPGKYLVTWDMSFRSAAGGSTQEIHGGIMINNSPIGFKAEAHRTINTANASGSMSGTNFFDLSVDDEVSVWLMNTSSTTNITIEHVNCTLTWVGKP